MAPWALSVGVSRNSFMHNMIMSTMLQFPATPLRLVVSFPNLRTRFRVLDSVLGNVPPAVSTKMAAREHREIHDVEQTKKMTPLITRETVVSQESSELVFGVSICDLDFGV